MPLVMAKPQAPNHAMSMVARRARSCGAAAGMDASAGWWRGKGWQLPYVQT
jgi:hypothetical protein